MFQTKFIVFAIVALMAAGSAVAIIGGQDAYSARFPYFAYLKSYQLDAPNYLHVCGGTLVAKQWVLTAAHCLVNSDGVEVILDVGNLRNKEEIGRETFNVTKSNYHFYPEYKENHQFVKDLALVKLPSLKSHTEYIHPVKFSCSTTPLGTEVIAMGYGRTSQTSEIFAKVLQTTKMNTIDLEKCVSNIHSLEFKSSLVCANGPQTAICAGDEGGPLVSAKTGQLIGVTSHVDGICTLGNAHVFTGVLPYIQWIEGTIDDYICKKQARVNH